MKRTLALMLLLLSLCSSAVVAGPADDAKAELTKINIAYDANNFVMHASTGNTAVVKLFLAAGMPPDAQSTTGWTPLIGAASRGQKETARILIAAGANVNARTLNNETPVFMAVMGSDVDTVKELLANGADPSIKTHLGLTAVAMANMLKKSEIVTLLSQQAVAVSPPSLPSAQQPEILSPATSPRPPAQADNKYRFPVDYPSIPSKTTLIMLNAQSLDDARTESNNKRVSEKPYYYLGSRAYGMFQNTADIMFSLMTPYSMARYLYYKSDVQLKPIDQSALNTAVSGNNIVSVATEGAYFPGMIRPHIANVVIRKNGTIYQPLPQTDYAFSFTSFITGTLWFFPIDLFNANEEMEIIAVDSRDNRKEMKLTKEMLSKIK